VSSFSIFRRQNIRILVFRTNPSPKYDDDDDNNNNNNNDERKTQMLQSPVDCFLSDYVVIIDTDAGLRWTDY